MNTETRLHTTEQTANLYKAIAQVQRRVIAIEPDAQNPQLRNKYTSLDAIRKKMQPALTDAGLAILQPLTTATAGRVEVATIVAHCESGESLTAMASIPVPETNRGTNAAQVEGSAISYLRRYALMSLFGFVSGEDDDAASVQTTQREQTSRTTAGNGSASLSDRQAKMVHAIRKLGLSDSDIEAAVSAVTDGKGRLPSDLSSDDLIDQAWREAQAMAEIKASENAA